MAVIGWVDCGLRLSREPQEGKAMTEKTDELFLEDLRSVINRGSRENVSNTPDFLLAEFLISSLANVDLLISTREKWYGISNTEVQRLTSLNTSLNEQNARLEDDNSLLQAALAEAEDDPDDVACNPRNFLRTVANLLKRTEQAEVSYERERNANNVACAEIEREDLRRRLDRLVGIISEAAPLAWAAGGNEEAAKAWEIKAMAAITVAR